VLGGKVALLSKWFPTFRKNMSLVSSRIQRTSKTPGDKGDKLLRNVGSRLGSNASATQDQITPLRKKNQNSQRKGYICEVLLVSPITAVKGYQK
jgi:hypothetical protein